jgi:hypothetical protein
VTHQREDRVRSNHLRVALATLALVLTTGAAAQSKTTPAPDWVPAALKPWTEWVLHDTPDARCPRVGGFGERTCVFASSLSLAIDDSGAIFKVDVSAYRLDAPLQLPGHAGAWPVDVRLDGRPLPVSAAQNLPQVFLPAGPHHVEGRLSWQRMPAQLTIPSGYASVSVLLRGRAAHPDDGGIIWLVESGSHAAAEADSASVRIFRRVFDDVPARVETAIELTVAGKPREITVPRAVLPGFTALQLRSTLPIRLDGGDLRVQAVAGKSWVYVLSWRDTPLSELRLPAGSDAEVWSFAAVDAVRRVEVEGPVPVDPRQADVPGPWQQLPAWRIKAGEALRVTERHRGDAGQTPSRLNLARTLWLDEDGVGLTFRDQLAGTLSGLPGDESGASAAPASWRLSMQEPFELGHARFNGQDQYLTRIGPTGASGVELRSANVNLEADGRVKDRSGPLSVAGWSSDLQQASATLIVPPGWRLVHASGVEHAVGAWTEKWTLWDLFLTLLICVAAARVFGRWTAVMLAAALALSWTVPQSPAWLWLLPIVAAAAEQAAGGAARVGRWATFVKRAGFAVVAIGIVVFSVGQIRGALHPVLEEGGSPDFAAAGGSGAPVPVEEKVPAVTSPASPPLAEPVTEAKSVLEAGMSDSETLKKDGSLASALLSQRPARSLRYEAVDPTAKVQTGPGVPSWRWRTYALQWNGPVKAGQPMRLWLAPPWLVRIGSIVSVLLLVAALWMMAGRPRFRFPPFARRASNPVSESTGAAAALAIILASGVLGVALLCTSPSAAAQQAQPVTDAAVPTAQDGWQSLLRDLHNRLLEPPVCAPSCSSIQRLTVLARPGLVELRAEIHAQVDAVIALPGGAAWREAHNEIDGRAGEFTDHGNGQIAVRTSAGVHTVVRTLSTGTSNEIAIRLPSAPGAIETRLDGWQISGLRDDGTAGESLNLVRTQHPSSGAPSAAASSDRGIPPLARIDRTLVLGSRWQVRTVIQRVDGGTRPQEVRVALLPNEAVTTPAVRVVDGVALVNVLPGAAAGFDSDLPTRSPITLQAGKEPGQFDVWNLEASNMWSVNLGGTPPVLHVRDGLWGPQWRPWPGESATLTIQRPEGVPGNTLTIDEVQVHVIPGAQESDTHATVAIRASLGGTHRFELPEGARILALKKDGRDLPAYSEGRNVPILVEPGAHRIALTWREPRGIRGAFHLPQLGLGASAVNATIETTVPEDRWLLLAWGPTMGPVVLFWSMLVVLVAVALVLARLVRSPLSSAGWIVLAVGAGQAGLVPALTVLAFIAAVSARERWGQELTTWKFDLMQIVFALFAVAAVATLFGAVHNGLLGRPSMLVVGNGSSDTLLRWYQDRVTDTTPAATVLSLPLWVWRVAMLAWSVWLALTVVRVAGWTWQAFASGGRWKKARVPVPAAQAPEPEPPADGVAPAAR